jgi:hypothetical protein
MSSQDSSQDDRPTSRRSQEYGLPGPTQGQPTQSGGQRQRPSYGLPGPQQGRPGQAAPGGYGSPTSGPDAQQGQPGSSDPFGPPPTPTGPMGYEGGPGYPVLGADGTHRAGGSNGTGGTGGGLGGTAGPQKRRGIIPLVVGIILLLISPFPTLIGVAVGSSGLVDDLTSSKPLDGDSATEQLDSWQMVIVAVPTGDVDNASCTMSSPDNGALVEQSTSGQIPLENGRTYELTRIGVASSSTEVSITCDGSNDAVYIGPMSMWGFMGRMLAGFGISTVIGILGIVLTIVGIVKLVRSRRR